MKQLSKPNIPLSLNRSYLASTGRLAQKTFTIAADRIEILKPGRKIQKRFEEASRARPFVPGLIVARILETPASPPSFARWKRRIEGGLPSISGSSSRISRTLARSTILPQGREWSIDANHREIETFRGRYLYTMIDRASIINSDLEHLRRLVPGSRGGDRRACTPSDIPRHGEGNTDRPGVINVHKSSCFEMDPWEDPVDRSGASSVRGRDLVTGSIASHRDKYQGN